MMKRTIIFGAGNLGGVLSAELSKDHEIVGFIDNNKSLHGKMVANYPVLGGTEKIKELDYDEIVIASTMRFDDIKNSLAQAGIGTDKLNHEIQNRLLVEVQARNNFLRDFAKEHGAESKEASVAEGGVFQGMFASEINRNFSDRKLYLFDSFKGFDARDVHLEKKSGYSDVKSGYYNETSEGIVMNKMPFPEHVQIKKGYFPDTLEGMEGERFLFVNLDFDLYLPTYEGLKYFYPRMVENGMILIHDYYTEFYHGVKKAVSDFEKLLGRNVLRFPIGDGLSIAVVGMLNDKK